MAAWSHRQICLLAGLMIIATGSVANLTLASDLLSPAEAGRLGMVESWHRQASVIGGAQSLVDVKLHVDRTRERHLVEVTREKDGQVEVLSRRDVNQLDRFGKPMGLEEAKRLAMLERLRWKRRGIETKVTEAKIPEITLYTLAKDGTVESRNAETGELNWISRNGNPDLFCGVLGVNDHVVTLINGSVLYHLSADNGKVLRQNRLRGTPLSGSTISGNYALVPTTHGAVEEFQLPLDEEGEPYEEKDMLNVPMIEMVHGRVSAAPTVSPGSSLVAWGTMKSHVYVMETEGDPSLMFRFDTDGVVSSEVAAAEGGRFFFGSEHGHVYGIRATRSGEVMWRQSVGQPVYEPTFVAGNRLLVATAFKNLYCLELATGEMLWDGPVPQIDHVIGESGDFLFARTNSNRLAVLSAETGSRLRTVSNVSLGFDFTNRLTDRLYLIGAGGMVQCLRPIDSPLPKLKVSVEPQAEAETDELEKTPPPDEGAPATDPFPGGGGDPFAPAGGGGDPFAPAGGGGDPFAPAGGGGDPFAPAAGGGDPFAPAAGGGGDPFGGDGDPFGGDGDPFGGDGN